MENYSKVPKHQKPGDFIEAYSTYSLIPVNSKKHKSVESFPKLSQSCCYNNKDKEKAMKTSLKAYHKFNSKADKSVEIFPKLKQKTL